MLAGWQVSDQRAETRRDSGSWKLSSNCPVLAHVLFWAMLQVSDGRKWSDLFTIWVPFQPIWSAWSLGCWPSTYTALSFSHWFPTVTCCFCSACSDLDKSCSFKLGPINGEEHNPSVRFPQTWKTNPALCSFVFQSFRRLSVNPARGFSCVSAVGWGC